MKLPKPELGLVFRYDYVWSRAARRGNLTSKERPACIAMATDSEVEPQLVLILPITHGKPTDDTSGIEIPPTARRMLGLDDDRCWVIVSEHNIDDWPNPGIAPLPGAKKTYAYGFLPPALFDKIKTEFLKRYSKARGVRR